MQILLVLTQVVQYLGVGVDKILIGRPNLLEKVVCYTIDHSCRTKVLLKHIVSIKIDTRDIKKIFKNNTFIKKYFFRHYCEL